MFLGLAAKKFYVRIRHCSKKISFGFNSDIAIHSIFEGYNKVGKRSSFAGKMGRHSYIGDNCIINAEIGRYTSIGSNVVIPHGSHPSSIFVSTSPVFYSTKKQTGKTYTNLNLYSESTTAEGSDFDCVIGHDVWIGYGVTIMPGITI